MHNKGILTKTVLLNGIEYSINEEEKTSAVFNAISEEKEVIIPRSIIYQSNEYIVTSISSNAFTYNFFIRTLFFADDSKLQTICKQAFDKSGIKYLKIPSSVVDLNEGWCQSSNNLERVNVNAENPYYYSIDDLIVISKTSKESVIFDALVFCSRAIEYIKIPSYIKVIDQYAFQFCRYLKNVEFPVDSELEIIEKNAFFFSNEIVNINFPPHLTKICERAFNYIKVKEIIFSDDSELQIIEKYAFQYTELERIIFPPSLKHIEMGVFYGSTIENLTISSNLILDYGWCEGCVNLVHVDVSPDNPYYKSYEGKYIIGKSSNDSENYDVLVFAPRDIVIAEIPDFIKYIGSYSFEMCRKLEEFKTSNNSKLQSIEDNAFSGSSLENLSIPTNFCEFKREWCKDVSKLNNINISPKNKNFIFFDNKFILKKTNEENHEYDLLQFARRDIEIAIIPSYVRIIGDHSFQKCKKLKKVVINADSKLEIIEKRAFAESTIQSFTVTSRLTKICEEAFTECQELEIFDIPLDSKLNIIEKKAFYWSTIKHITIPPHIKHINESTFSLCKIKRIEFAPNSELQTIGNSAFERTSIVCFSVPPHVTHISACEFDKLQIIEFGDNSEIKHIDIAAFYKCKLVLIMVAVEIPFFELIK